MIKKIIYLIIAILLANMALAEIEISFKGACNGDEFCIGKENSQNCPQDCPSGNVDGYCDGALDNICDPDCPSEADPDCLPVISAFQDVFYKTYVKPLSDFRSLRRSMQKAYIIMITGFSITVVSAILFIIFLTMHIKKIKRERISTVVEKPKIKQAKKPLKKPEMKAKVEMPLKPKKEAKEEEYYDLVEKHIRRLIKYDFTIKQIKEKMLEKYWPEDVIDKILDKIYGK
jgi:hypothetical protein